MVALLSLCAEKAGYRPSDPARAWRARRASTRWYAPAAWSPRRGQTGSERHCASRMPARRGVAFSTFLAAEAGRSGAEASWMDAVE